MARSMPSATVAVADTADALVLQIRGELDIASRDDIEPVIMVALAVTPAVVLDVSEVDFCDSQGLAMLIACTQEAAAEGTTFTIANPRPQMRRLIEITDLTRLLASV
jgi:anti-sigma B factor antagonist